MPAPTPSTTSLWGVYPPPAITQFQKTRFPKLWEEAMDVFSKYQEVASIIDNNLFIRATLKGGKNSSATEMNAIAQFLGDSNTLISITDEHFPVLGLKQENCIEMTWIQSILQWYGFPYTTTNPDFLLNRNPNSTSTWPNPNVRRLNPSRRIKRNKMIAIENTSLYIIHMIYDGPVEGTVLVKENVGLNSYT
nr:berberine bridge enzyme-like 21 [Ipomoea trifida]